MRHRAVRGVVGAVLLAVTSSCESPETTSVVVLSAQLNAVAPEVERAVLTVADPAVPDVALVESELGHHDADWSISLDGLPAPGRYTFTVRAYDAADTVRYAGSVTADIGPGVTTQLAILVQEVATSEPPVEGPVLSAVTVSSNPVGAGGRVSVSAQPGESSGTFSYRWEDACGGAFDDPYAPSTVWTAPAPAPSAPCALSIRVSDGTFSATLYLAIHFR